MRRYLFIGCFIAAMTPGIATADVANDCHKDLRPEVRVRACSEIIADPHVAPRDKAIAYVLRGNARTDAGAAQQALADFTAAIRLKKDNPPAFAGRGRANLYVGQLARSIADYNEAIRLSSDSAELYVERGHTYAVEGNLDAAISDFTQAIRLNPSWGAFNERGVANFRKSQFDKALDDFNQAMALFPSPEVRANRGRVYEALVRPKDAIEDYRRALQDDPSLVDAREALRRLGVEDAVTAETDQRIHQGELLAQEHCSTCHAVGNVELSPDKNAPPFRSINRRRPLYWLRAPVTQSVFATHEKMPEFSLTFDELDKVVAYINSLSPPGLR